MWIIHAAFVNYRFIMRRWHRSILAIALALGPPAVFGAAPATEDDAFKAAANAFSDGFYDRAEKEFGGFVQKYPNSARLGEVILLQAQSRFQLKRYDGVVELLTAQLTKPSPWGDKYRFWLAEAQSQRGDYPAAIAAYAQLLRDFPDSLLGPNACYGEALCWFKSSNMAKVIECLRPPSSGFQKLAQALPNDPYISRGFLLLSEALLRQQEYPAAEETLSLLGKRNLTPELDWQRLDVLTRLQLADLQPEKALQSVTNLLSLTAAAGLRERQPQAVALHGEALQKANRTAAALSVYEQNLAEGRPAEQRRQALLKIVELSLAQNQMTQAVQRLEKFAGENPKDPLSDLACLTLGELHLKSFYEAPTNSTASAATAGSTTNALSQAQAQFDQLIALYPRSPLLGKAYLDRGWCLWESGKFMDSYAAFTNAAVRLPASEDQAMARLKAADVRFQLGDYATARGDYRSLVDDYAQFAGLPSSVLEQALSKIVHASVAVGDLTGASEALTQLLSRYPTSPKAERSLMRVGQLHSQLGKTARARELFDDLLKRFPNSSLEPEVRLAIARTYVQEPDWPRAIAGYDQWVAQYTDHPSLAKAEFDRAWVYALAPERQTNAFALFTRFVTRFPTNELAPLAQEWIGDHYYSQGDYMSAESSFQKLYQQTNWPPSELTYRARLMAGRAAFERRSYRDTTNYFTTLINLLLADTNSPPALLPEAFCGLGDAIYELSPLNTTNPLSRYAEAINAYSRVAPETNRWAPLAWGQIAECHFQLTAQDPKDPARYTNAIAYYQKVIGSPVADARVRGLAEIGWAKVLEAWTQQTTRPANPKIEMLDNDNALNHYLNVVYDKAPDPFAFQWAGKEAGRLLEDQQQWAQALKLYDRLTASLPALRSSLAKKIAAAKAKLTE